MNFSDQEMRLIVDAKKKASHATTVRIIILLMMAIAICLMALDRLDPDAVAYSLVAAVVLAMAQPQFGQGPKYEDLVALLDRKARDSSE